MQRYTFIRIEHELFFNTLPLARLSRLLKKVFLYNSKKVCIFAGYE